MPARKKAIRNKARTATKSTVARALSPKKARATAKTKIDRTVYSTKATMSSALPNKAISQKQSKAQIYAEISELTKLSKSEIKTIIAAMRNVIERHVKPKGSGEVTLPDLGIKVRRVQKKATKARMGRNPFTGEEIQIPAKPARKSVKVSALKTLKALIDE